MTNHPGRLLTSAPFFFLYFFAGGKGTGAWDGWVWDDDRAGTMTEEAGAGALGFLNFYNIENSEQFTF